MGTLKYMNLLLHLYIHRQSVQYKINEQSSFLFFRFPSNWERERERVYKIGYKEKQSQGYLSYFFDGVPWRIFLLLRANWLYGIFNTGLKKMASSCLAEFLRLLLPGVLCFGSVSYEPCPTTNFLIIYFRWREGVPTSVLGSQPIVWLLPSSFRCQATRVRLPSTNICWSPRDPHSFLTVTLWWLATVNSNTGNSINLIFIVSVGHHVTLYLFSKYPIIPIIIRYNYIKFYKK